MPARHKVILAGMSLYRRPGVFAFTLFELMVVITIMCLLLAMLLPVVGMVRDTSRKVVCASNMRQIGLSIFAYAADHNGWCVPAGFGAGPGQYVVWDANLLLDYARERSGLDWNDFTNEMSNQSVGIYHCPTRGRRSTGSYWAISDYGLNSHIFASNDQNNQGKPWFNVKMSSISEASTVYMVGDTLVVEGGNEIKTRSFYSQDMMEKASWLPEARNFRHRGQMVIAYADGHAGSFRVNEMDTGNTGFRGWYLGSPQAGDWHALYAPPWGPR